MRLVTLVASVVAILSVQWVAMAQGTTEEPRTVTIQYRGTLIEVDEQEPLVSCIVAQEADIIDGRWVTMVTWVRDQDGRYVESVRWTTRQTGPLADGTILDCYYLGAF